MTEIRIYVEGGGDGSESKAQLRRGFAALLTSLRELARAKRIGWTIVACGARNDTFDDFKTALETHPAAFNVLLVDSEEPVTLAPWQHLRQRDGWQRPAGGDDENCHLMVVMMEAWLIADADALAKFYGQRFNHNALPASPNVESLSKATIEDGLRNATRRTTKRSYHKIQHAAKLLALIDVHRVRRRAMHFERLWTTLTRIIGDA